uniref:Uncharacterized protein n=1 Tax=Timema monikensis TaxID=170555 RepID=A0A7R9EB47_9NEOP|nr:unnamed protein product [Timema monikensis]
MEMFCWFIAINGLFNHAMSSSYVIILYVGVLKKVIFFNGTFKFMSMVVKLTIRCHKFGHITNFTMDLNIRGDGLKNNELSQFTCNISIHHLQEQCSMAHSYQQLSLMAIIERNGTATAEVWITTATDVVARDKLCGIVSTLLFFCPRCLSPLLARGGTSGGDQTTLSYCVRA